MYVASTLELFDTPEIPIVLREIKRVLKPTGGLCVVSIPKKGRENSLSLKLYEWFFKTFPNISTCRPIYIEDSLTQAGFRINNVDETFMSKFFPMKIVIANLK